VLPEDIHNPLHDFNRAASGCQHDRQLRAGRELVILFINAVAENVIDSKNYRAVKAYDISVKPTFDLSVALASIACSMKSLASFTLGRGGAAAGCPVFTI